MDFYLTAILQALCFGPLAIGLFLSMKIFNIPDITTDGSYTLGAVITAIGLSSGLSLPFVFILATIGGALAGSITAWIHTRLHINALLAGILVMTALYSVNLSLMGRSNIPLLQYDTAFTFLDWFEYGDYNILLVLLLVGGVVVAMATYMLRSDFGIAMRATGDSESMIRALGVDTNRMKIIGLAISNGLVALSGCLMAQFQGFVDINMGIGIVISGLGSVIVGESIIHLLRISRVLYILMCMVAGALLFQWVLAFTLRMGVDASLLKLVTALLVLLIVAIPQWNFFSKLKR